MLIGGGALTCFPAPGSIPCTAGVEVLKCARETIGFAPNVNFDFCVSMRVVLVGTAAASLTSSGLLGRVRG